MFGLRQPTGGFKTVKFTVWPIRWRPPDQPAVRGPEWTLAYGLCHWW